MNVEAKYGPILLADYKFRAGANFSYLCIRSWMHERACARARACVCVCVWERGGGVVNKDERIRRRSSGRSVFLFRY